MLAGECGIRPTTVFDTEGYRSRVAAEVDMERWTATRRRSSAVGGRAAIASACTRPRKRSPTRACSTPRVDRSRVGVFLGAGTADLLRNEEFYRTWITQGLRPHAPLRRLESFPSTPVDVIAGALRPRRPPRLRRRGLFVEHDRDRARRSRRFASGRADAALAGGTDALSRLTFSGFNLLRLMDAAPCRPFDRSRAGMNIGEGAGILVLENLETRAAPRRAHLRGTGRPRPRLRGVPSDRAGA